MIRSSNLCVGDRAGHSITKANYCICLGRGTDLDSPVVDGQFVLNIEGVEIDDDYCLRTVLSHEEWVVIDRVLRRMLNMTQRDDCDAKN